MVSLFSLHPGSKRPVNSTAGPLADLNGPARQGGRIQLPSTAVRSLLPTQPRNGTESGVFLRRSTVSDKPACPPFGGPFGGPFGWIVPTRSAVLPSRLTMKTPVAI